MGFIILLEDWLLLINKKIKSGEKKTESYYEKKKKFKKFLTYVKRIIKM